MLMHTVSCMMLLHALIYMLDLSRKKTVSQTIAYTHLQTLHMLLQFYSYFDECQFNSHHGCCRSIFLEKDIDMTWKPVFIEFGMKIVTWFRLDVCAIIGLYTLK